MRSTRFNPASMNMIKTECAHRWIDFSNYIRYAATAAMKKQQKVANQPLDMSSETHIPFESAF